MKKLREKCKNKKGFTMVELIVVIVIILVLAAVLVPSLLKYVNKANEANCKADAATILSQLQSDYAAAQANDQTGVTIGTDYKVGDVSVTVTTTTLAPTKGTAQYTEKSVAGTGTAYKEISSFAYNNGKYVATWTLDPASGASPWTITPATTSTPET